MFLYLEDHSTLQKLMVGVNILDCVGLTVGSGVEISAPVFLSLTALAGTPSSHSVRFLLLPSRIELVRFLQQNGLHYMQPVSLQANLLTVHQMHSHG